MVIFETLVLLFILVAAAVLLSYGAESIAEKYGANFAGSVILAFITTLPEYMFVFWAALKGEYMVAVGSAVGAATMLITGYGLVIFTATTISRKPVKVIELSHATRIDALYLILTALVALVLALENNGFDLKDGIILIVLFGVYVYHLARGAIEFGEKHKIEEKSCLGVSPI